jgi:hypothetical protein
MGDHQGDEHDEQVLESQHEDGTQEDEGQLYPRVHGVQP